MEFPGFASALTENLQTLTAAAEERGRLHYLMTELLLRPTRPSRDLAAVLEVGREELLRLYRLIRESRALQDLLTHRSPQRRRISFLRRELLPSNLPRLEAMFNGEICQPTHVEFHPSLVCNLRCRACPNCRDDQNGERHFLGYPKLGEPLSRERLRLIQELFLERGLTSFSFGGGGEPTLSELTLTGIEQLRRAGGGVEISLYTNGIFPPGWGEREFEILVGSLDKMRFSIDAANAREWSQYKGRPPEFFETLWGNIARVVAARRRLGGGARLGASCLVSTIAYRNLDGFLARAREGGLDFCDIKEVETCFGEKAEFKASDAEYGEFIAQLLSKVQAGHFAPLDVVVDDRLLPDAAGATVPEEHPRCWVASCGRMLTVGPYGELHPCSDAANPGSQQRRALTGTIGQLSEFATPAALGAQFAQFWAASLDWRSSLTRADCAYCVPSHMNYNLAVEKLFVDRQFGIRPEEQPFAAEMDHYLTSRGFRSGAIRKGDRFEICPRSLHWEQI